MSYDKDLVFLDLEWITYHKKRYISQIGIIRINKNNFSLIKQKLFKLKTKHFNLFQQGLIGATTNHDKGTTTLTKKVVEEIFNLINDSYIHIFFAEKDSINDDINLLLSNVKFKRELNYIPVRLNAISSLRHLYADYKQIEYIDNIFHNALEDAKMLMELCFSNHLKLKNNLYYYEYSCNYDFYSYYSFNKEKIKLLRPLNPNKRYVISNVNISVKDSIIINNFSYSKYSYYFDLIDSETNQKLNFNNENINDFLKFAANILILRNKTSLKKIEKIQQTILLENNTFLVLLTSNIKRKL